MTKTNTPGADELKAVADALRRAGVAAAFGIIRIDGSDYSNHYQLVDFGFDDIQRGGAAKMLTTITESDFVDCIHDTKANKKETT